MEELVTCPNCQGVSTKPIIYGKPDLAVLKASEYGLVELGGCIVEENQPNKICIECGFRWVERPLKKGNFEYDQLKIITDNWIFRFEKELDGFINDVIESNTGDEDESFCLALFELIKNSWFRVCYEAGTLFGEYRFVGRDEVTDQFEMCNESYHRSNELFVIIQKLCEHLFYNDNLRTMHQIAIELAPILRDINRYEEAKLLIEDIRKIKRAYITEMKHMAKQLKNNTGRVFFVRDIHMLLEKQ